MYKTIFLISGAAVALLSGCATQRAMPSGLSVAPTESANGGDHVTAVDRWAHDKGVNVIWINAPARNY